MTSTNPRDEQIAAFYARHVNRLQRVVAAHVIAPTQTIEDACQNAWTSLLRRDDITLDDRGVKWLTTVAIRDGWRLAGRARDVPRDVTPPSSPDENGAPGPASPATGTDEQAIARTEHSQRIADLQILKPRERRDLYLLALGYRYHEIAEATGSTYTAVNRRLAEGRAQLRRLDRARRDLEESHDEEGGELPSRAP